MEWTWLAGVVLAGLPGVEGGRRLRRAARAQSLGRHEAARRDARSGGTRIAAGAALLLALIALAGIGGTAATTTTLAAATLLTAAGTAGLLGGLSGKPRPSGDVALALYFLGWILAAASRIPGAGA
jgi:hypothetical protein